MTVMRTRIVAVYQWATMGGVERVFLNRAEAFREYGVKIKQDIYFYHDAGGVMPLRRYIRQRGLDDFLEVVDQFDPNRYDTVFLVDTPQLLVDYPNLACRVVFECHTPYRENRRYLATLPDSLKVLVVPSDTFREAILEEAPNFSGKLFVLRNFVPWDASHASHALSLPDWVKRPLLYLGRIDRLKNVIELLDGFVTFRDHFGDELMLVIVGPVSNEVDLEGEISRRGLVGRVILMPAIGFERVPDFLRAMRKCGAIFVSCSKGESFGLAVAEAIATCLPVILSDIPEHAYLVSRDADCLYPLGQPHVLAQKMRSIIDVYDAKSELMADYRQRFSARAFIDDWHHLAAQIGLGAES